MKKFLPFWIKYFILGGYKFLQINDLTIKTFNERRYLNFKYYIRNLMQIAELNLIRIISENPHLVNSLDNNINHPLITQFSKIPLKNQKL